MKPSPQGLCSQSSTSYPQSVPQKLWVAVRSGNAVGANSFAKQAAGLPLGLPGAAAQPIANEFAPTSGLVCRFCSRNRQWLRAHAPGGLGTVTHNLSTPRSTVSVEVSPIPQGIYTAENRYS
ncbi:hypothetical protein E8F11_15995 [Pseudomonas sp. BN417]|nr:hypothetical protein [Pseudomonas sp. BN417]